MKGRILFALLIIRHGRFSWTVVTEYRRRTGEV